MDCPTGAWLRRAEFIWAAEWHSNSTNGGLTVWFKRLSVDFIYFEYGETLPVDTEVMTLFLSTKARYETAVGYANQLDWGKKRWPGTFEYRCGRVPSAPQQSVWLMRCYGNTYFWAISGSDEASNKDGG